MILTLYCPNSFSRDFLLFDFDNQSEKLYLYDHNTDSSRLVSRKEYLIRHDSIYTINLGELYAEHNYYQLEDKSNEEFYLLVKLEDNEINCASFSSQYIQYIIFRSLIVAHAIYPEAISVIPLEDNAYNQHLDLVKNHKDMSIYHLGNLSKLINDFLNAYWGAD